MEDRQYPVIAFGLDYGGELVFCEAVMHDDRYNVLFDGKWIASITHTENWDWKQASGTILPRETINEIGLRIENYYA